MTYGGDLIAALRAGAREGVPVPVARLAEFFTELTGEYLTFAAAIDVLHEFNRRLPPADLEHPNGTDERR